MKSYRLKIIALLTIAISGCVFKQTYMPALNNNAVAVIDSIKIRYGFEDVRYIAKKETSITDKRNSLTVKFINGKKLPGDTAQTLIFLVKQIRRIIKNPNEFDTYIISLDKITKKDDETSDESTSAKFKPDDLK
jgi:hypothetical protein